MNKFINDIVFVIVNDSDITNEMINKSNSTKKENMPSKTVDGVLKRIIEFYSKDIPDSLVNYQWYCKNTITPAWESL